MLKAFLNFKETPGEMNGIPVLFYHSENGESWYDVQHEFRLDTLKIGVARNGKIVTFAHDASTLSPHAMSVYEVEEKDVPPELYNGKPHSYDPDTGKITPWLWTEEERASFGESERSQLMTDAIGIAQPLQDALDLDNITPEELARLTAWKAYRIALMRTDITTWPEINWPAKPDL